MQEYLIINRLYSVVCRLSSVLCPLSSVICHLSSVVCPLHLSRTLYKSTFLCKTNPILSAVGGLQMNVNVYITRAYENIANWTLGESKPNSNPIKPNFKKAKMNISYVKTTNYEQRTMNYANNKQTQSCPP